MTKFTHQKLTMVAEGLIRTAQYSLDKFTASFASNPAYALEWSASTFVAAAQQNVGKTLLAYLENVAKNRPELDPDAQAQIVIDEIKSQVLRKSMWPDRSTSSPSNEMSLCNNSAFAEVVFKFEVLT